MNRNERKLTMFKRAIIVGAAVLLGGAASGLGAESAPIRVMARAGLVPVRTAIVGIGVEGLTWSSRWEGGEAAVLKANGVELERNSGEGEVTWIPARAGTYTLTHETESEGVSTGEVLSAVFVVAQDWAPYCVIDLANGPGATNYPVTYLDEEPAGGFNTDAYKTTKLALKLCRANAYGMGDDPTNWEHRVTMTKPFYMGLFEVTQKQWQQVMGSNPSYWQGDKRPVEQVSYEAIRGASAGSRWPKLSGVDADSFLGKLRARTGIDFDLPMESQWEYACRAGSTNVYSYGSVTNGDYMWYEDNSEEQSHPVGRTTPNAWGFYDMHGNVWEWCLDWYADELAYGVDPKGAVTGTNRVIRGGSWFFDGEKCESAYRGEALPSGDDGDYGFRLARTLWKSEQWIDFAPIGPQAFTNTVVLEATSSSGMEVEFSVSDGPGVITDGVLSFTGIGSVTVTASQEGSSDWTPVSVSQTVEVTGIDAQVTLGGLAQTYDGTAHVASVTTVPDGLAVSVTYDGETNAPVNAGEYAVSAVVDDALYTGVATGLLVVAKADQTIAFPSIGAQIVTNSVALSATATSGLGVSFAVTDGPGTLENGVLTFTGVGTVVVVASQDGDGNWNAAAPVTNEVVVSEAAAQVTLGDLAQMYDGTAHAVSVTTVPDGLAVNVTYDGETNAPVNAGEYAVSAVVDDALYTGVATGLLVVAKGDQTITFPSIGAQIVTNSVALSATASSGLGVSFAVTDGPGTIESGVLSFTGVGTVTVVASQDGDTNWNAAAPVTNEGVVSAAAAQVTLDGLTQTYDGAAHAVSVTTVPDGLTVNVTYDGETNAPVNVGEYAVSAVVDDALYTGVATGLLVVAKADQTIAFPSIGAQIVTNSVALSATATSGLGVSFAVTDGPGAIENGILTFTGVGTVTVVATQGGDANWNAAAPVTNEVEVTGFLTLTVASAHGTAAPSVGAHEVVIGTEISASVSGSPVSLGTGLRAVCTGWMLDGGEPATGTGTGVTFTMTNSALLTWQWETQALVEAEALAHGTVSGGGWYALGSAATLTATPESGHPFTGWEGDVPAGNRMANPAQFTVTKPAVALGTFYTTYYVSGSGDDAMSGLSWSRAKREISAALEEAAPGDTVLATNGVYGPIEVPADVVVRNAAAVDAASICGENGGRAATLGAAAVLEGFTVTGADTELDGAGVWMASDARTERCVLTGNRTTGTGGGAFGGTLVNCLVTANEASAGGGAASSTLRHCTVTENVGGGAKDCRTENSIVWGNEDGDLDGGTAVFSCASPLPAGTGNIEDDPRFVGAGNFRLAYESPCLGAAADSDVKTDLDGAPRPQPTVFGGALAPDMGCYEYVPKARYVWANGSGTAPYETWATAATNIQDALDISTGGDRVVVEAGRYDAIVMSNAVTLTGLRGPEETIIDGGDAGRAVTMTAGGVLEGFTVVNGAADECAGVLADGGATVRDVTVAGNRATDAEGFGGGVCLYGGSTAENVTATSNSAAYGAGIFATETSTVWRCTLEANTASLQGGGAYLQDGSAMTSSRAEGNTAVRGAGVYASESEVAESELVGNTATGNGGGAAVIGGVFHNNIASGNRANNGGGFYANGAAGHDCLVVENQAGKSGGGVYMEGDSEFWNLTVADNASAGAGVLIKGTGLLGNSIVMGNTGSNLDAAASAEVRYSCVSPAPVGEGNFAADPVFVGNGDWHLRAESPCVDAGESQEWMCDATDIDGQRRVEEEGEGRDGRVDVGADEAALDVVGGPTAADSAWEWRVVPGATLQLQSTRNLLDASSWTNAGERFTATNGTWRLEEPFDGTGMKAWRLLWIK